jgi:metal-dependent amidase/aminoacylase/carboxypeptidase family protein
VAGGIVGEANVASVCMSVGAEDMTYFLEAMPGCYLRLGSGNLDTGLIHLHHNHSALFSFDEALLPIGVKLLTQLTLANLSGLE